MDGKLTEATFVKMTILNIYFFIQLIYKSDTKVFGQRKREWECEQVKEKLLVIMPNCKQFCALAVMH